MYRYVQYVVAAMFEPTLNNTLGALYIGEHISLLTLEYYEDR